ncbi:hypothetical protein GCM10027515_17880 [Schumannella luteola]|uniref:Putative membrane protein YedE/YeeE n=1 Tax=Schumannella luteola TaxID=472059 RepID=A0A852YSZ4_9MICO|nr:hypothetical protein [Schumannella luteola]NYH00416.1 putative membrane protein YedE/YeeE [Schumannella luteola]TPX03672.1 hypothetical protein FJ656_16000 [Schumannella luteola]
MSDGAGDGAKREDARPDAPGTRLQRWATSALWPVAIAVPIVSILTAIIVRLGGHRDPDGADSSSTQGMLGGAGDGFLLQLAGIDAVLLLGTLVAAALVRVRQARGSAELSRPESWAVLAQAGGGALFALGIVLIDPAPGPAGQCLIMGLWAVVVGTGALIALAVRELRPRSSPTEERLP